MVTIELFRDGMAAVLASNGEQVAMIHKTSEGAHVMHVPQEAVIPLEDIVQIAKFYKQHLSLNKEGVIDA